MTKKRACWMGVTTALAVVALSAQAQANTQLIAQLDTASKRFQNVQANVSYDTYTRAARADSIETGTVYFERTPKGQAMGAAIYEQGMNTPGKVLNYDGGTLKIYTPGTKQVDIFNAGANQAKYDGFLTLGFGGSGKDLDRDWLIQDQGAETINGVKTEKLDLIGKDQSVKNLFKHVTIWVDLTRDISLKQIFYQADGDMKTTLYTNLRPNEKIDKTPYAIDPKATKTVH